MPTWRISIAISLWKARAVIARNFVERIRARCSRVGNTPFGGTPRDDLAPGLRLVAFERTAVIAYKVEDDRVRISNIFYGGRDFEALYNGSARSEVDDEDSL